MVSLPGLSAPAPPSVRAPRFELSFGGEEAHTWATSLVSLEVSVGLLPAVDRAVMVLAPPPGAPAGGLAAQAGAAAAGGLGAGGGGGAAFPVAPGDEGAIALGFADAGTTSVFSGHVASVRSVVGGAVRVVAANGGARLARLRIDEGYEQLTAGEVIRKLAGAAGVAVGTVEAGPKLAWVAVDGRESALHHVAALARRSDAAVRIDADGKLHVAALAGGAPVTTFRYGHDILRVELDQAIPVVDTVTVVGNGAAGSQGQGAAAWMIRDPSPVSATAGEGDASRTMPDGALRSGEAAARAASGWAGAAGRRAVTGRVTVPGAPEIVPGATLELAGVPFAAGNGMFVAMAVRHRYDAEGGLVTRVAFCHAAQGAGGLLGGLTGGLA